MKEISSLRKILLDFNYETNSFNNDSYILKDGKDKVLTFNNVENDILFNFDLTINLNVKKVVNKIKLLKINELIFLDELYPQKIISNHFLLEFTNLERHINKVCTYHSYDKNNKCDKIHKTITIKYKGLYFSMLTTFEATFCYPISHIKKNHFLIIKNKEENRYNYFYIDEELLNELKTLISENEYNKYSEIFNFDITIDNLKNAMKNNLFSDIFNKNIEYILEQTISYNDLNAYVDPKNGKIIFNTDDAILKTELKANIKRLCEIKKYNIYDFNTGNILNNEFIKLYENENGFVLEHKYYSPLKKIYALKINNKYLPVEINNELFYEFYKDFEFYAKFANIKCELNI